MSGLHFLYLGTAGGEQVTGHEASAVSTSLCLDLGRRVRALLEGKGLRSVAAEGFQAPVVVVSYTDDAGLHTGKTFLGEGLQTAAGVSLQCDELADFKTFRIGVFGLDKLHHGDRTVANLDAALVRILDEMRVRAAA